MPKLPIPIAWGVFWPLIQFQGCFFYSIWYPVILVIFDPKNTYFQTHLDLELHLDGAEKCPTHLSPLLGVCFDPFPSFQVFIGLIWQPSIMVYFNPKKGHFRTPPDLEWDQERS